jgi:hypothetical protein
LTVLIIVGLVVGILSIGGFLLALNEGGEKDWFFVSQKYPLTQEHTDKLSQGIVPKINIEGIEFGLHQIPEGGLYGYYANQGDLHWAWVRTELMDKLSKKAS